MGKALSTAFEKEKGPDLEKLAEEAKRADAKVQASAEKMARARSNAAKQIEIAEQKVIETRERSISADKKVQASEKALANARKQGDPDAIAYAEEHLARARENARPTSADMAAEDRLARAKQKYIDVSRDGVETLAKFKREQESANRKLSEAKTAADKASAGAEKAGRSFGGLGDKIKGAFRGKFGGVFRKVETEGDKAAGKVERRFKKAGQESGDGFGSKFTSGLKGGLVGVGAVVAGAIGVDQIWGAFTDASNLEQSIGAVDTVFKDSAAQMHAWADAAHQSLGMTKNSYNELATLLGTQLKNSGVKDYAAKTNELIGLGADFSAMFGGTATEAVEAISSALKGERDPIEKYGVSLRQSAIDAKAAELGFKKVGGSFDQQAQAAATLALIYDQSTDAQGRFAQESGTSANTVQKLTAKFQEIKTSLGEKLMPVFNAVGGWLLDTGLPAFERFGQGLQGIWDVLVKGEFTGALRDAFGWDEDSGAVAFLFTLRDAAIGLWENALKPLIGFVKDNVVPIFAGLLAGGIAVLVGSISAAIAAAGGLTAVITGAVASIAWVPIAIGAAVGALTWFFTQTETGKAIMAAVINWITDTAWPAIQTVSKWIADAAVWLWQNVLAPAWAGIKTAISATVSWITGTAWPVIKAVWDKLAGAAMWLWQNVLQPAWTGIKVAIALAVAAIMTSLDGVKWYFSNVIAPVVMWLWQNVFQPAWTGIKVAIALAVAAIMTYLDGVKWYFSNVIAPVVMWLWRNVFQPAWNGIKTAISVVVVWFQGTAWPIISSVIENVKRGFAVMRNALSVAWSAVKNTIINPVVSWFQSTVKPIFDRVTSGIGDAFSKLRDTVGRVWDAIRDKVKAPIRFVLEKVIQGGIVSNFNKIAETFNVSKLPDVWPTPGFARGGWTGPGSTYKPAGVVHADEFVIRKTSRRQIEKAAPGLLDSLNQYGAGALGYSGGGPVQGIADKVSSIAGDAWDTVKSGAGFVSDALADPLGAFKKLVSPMLAKIPGAGLVVDLAKAIPLRIVDGIGKALKPVASSPAAAPVGPVPPGASRSLSYAQQLARSFGLTMTSFRRPGARTAKGGFVSLHAMGRAMDFSNSSGPTPQMMGFFNALHPLRPTELLYSPAGARQWNRSGRMHDTSGATKRMHYNHVHVGFAGGGWTGAGDRLQPAGIVHADEFVINRDARMSISRAMPGFLEALNQRGARAFGGYASGGPVASVSSIRRPVTRQIPRVSVTAGVSGAPSATTVNVHVGETADGGLIGRRIAEALDLHRMAAVVNGGT